MRTETTMRQLYKLDELPEREQEIAIDRFRQHTEVDFDFVLEDCATVADMLGIDLRTRRVKLMNGSTRLDPCIWFSGFSSQGDGACFEGSYRYKRGALAAVKKYAPQDSKLHRIARELQDAQRPVFYCATANTSHRGYYYHSGCMSVDVSAEDADGRDVRLASTEDDITDALRGFADWIYSQLEREYEYQMSDEYIREGIEANEYEFTEDGELA